jgi:hypothetical protein
MPNPKKEYISRQNILPYSTGSSYLERQNITNNPFNNTRSRTQRRQRADEEVTLLELTGKNQFENPLGGKSRKSGGGRKRKTNRRKTRRL